VDSKSAEKGEHPGAWKIDQVTKERSYKTKIKIEKKRKGATDYGSFNT